MKDPGSSQALVIRDEPKNLWPAGNAHEHSGHRLSSRGGVLNSPPIEGLSGYRLFHSRKVELLTARVMVCCTTHAMLSDVIVDV